MWPPVALLAMLRMAGPILPLCPLPLLVHLCSRRGGGGLGGALSASRSLGRLGLARFIWVWGLSGPISLLGLPLVRCEVGPWLTPLARYYTRQGRASFGCPCPQVAWCLVCPWELPGRCLTLLGF